jgi:acetyl-CoA carboxylase biotin carboxyl carrier protein
MRVEELRQVVQWLEDARIGVFEIEDGDHRVRIVLQPDEVCESPDSVTIDDREDGTDGIMVAANVPGFLLIRHPQHTAPIVPLGGSVRAGDVVALIQIGSIYVPVIAGIDGMLVKILAVPQTLVGFGTPLLEIA